MPYGCRCPVELYGCPIQYEYSREYSKFLGVCDKYYLPLYLHTTTALVRQAATPPRS
jgi:hypothetical protein